MDRRSSLKTIILGTVGGSAIVSGATSCETPPATESTEEKSTLKTYGRTADEKERDAKLMAETFFNEQEMATITVLCGLILPADEKSGSAVDAEVPDFIEFVAKDMPHYQLPLRGGLMWLNHEANKRFETAFKDCTSAQQTEILDDIAYNAVLEENPDSPLAPGIKFFDLMRNLTVTGFYTSKEGVLTDLEYKGNVPNVWDGPPQDVLDQYGVAFDEKYMDLYITAEEREEIATWS